MIIFSTWVWEKNDQNYPMEGVGSNSKSHVAPGLNEKSQIWTYFKRDFLRLFCDFFAILSAHELFEPHLKNFTRDMNVSKNFIKSLSNSIKSYVLTSREMGPRIGPPGLGQLTAKGAGFDIHQSLISKEGNARFFIEVNLFYINITTSRRANA